MVGKNCIYFQRAFGSPLKMDFLLPAEDVKGAVSMAGVSPHLPAQDGLPPRGTLCRALPNRHAFCPPLSACYRRLRILRVTSLCQPVWTHLTES